MTADQGFELHPGAAQDITEIWEFIAKDNPLAARAMAGTSVRSKKRQTGGI